MHKVMPCEKGMTRSFKATADPSGQRNRRYLFSRLNLPEENKAGEQ
jgi:hypothetical protein